MHNKQTFKLGGADYSAPVKIGAGLRAKYNQNLMSAILNSPNGSEMINTIIKMSSRKRTVDPRAGELPDDIKHEMEAALIEQTLTEQYDTVMKTFMISQLYQYRLTLLETVLTPLPGSPTVQEGYDSAEEEEVTAIENFFAKGSMIKTEDASTSQGALEAKSETTI